VKRRTVVALLCAELLGALAPPSTSYATPELSARDMMERNFFVSKIKSLKTASTMLLVNDKGQTRERKSFTFSVLQPNGIDSKFLVKFTSPSDIKGTAFLQIEHIEADDDEWIYLPALGKSRRLVANNKKDSFVGSDFSYGDISLPNVELYEHRLVGSEVIDNHDCYEVESIPKSDTTKTDIGYGRKLTWLRKDNFLETKVEYYDLGNRLLKIQTVTQHKLLEPDTQRWIALRREMVNSQTGHKTVLTFEEVQAPTSVPEDLFTTRYLERE
jgi:outer membrane lipoprotein-sorting protein